MSYTFNEMELKKIKELVSRINDSVNYPNTSWADVYGLAGSLLQKALNENRVDFADRC
ncbi:MAG: hypothetical protein V7784_15250 [Oceanospirillaceae bacterium]